jgi:hypothetical protein
MKILKEQFGYFTILATIAFSFSLAVADTGLVISPPDGYGEGTETDLTPEMIDEILPWANNSKRLLTELLDDTKDMEALEARNELYEAIGRIVLQSENRSELLMRYALKRGLKFLDIISQQSAIDNKALAVHEVRVLRAAGELAVKYYENDLSYLEDSEISRSKNPMDNPFAEFGLDFAIRMFAINESVIDASAQFAISRDILGLLNWDLWRDGRKSNFAHIMPKIDAFRKKTDFEKRSESERQEEISDEEIVKIYLLQARSLYYEAVRFLQEQGVRIDPFSDNSRRTHYQVGSWVAVKNRWENGNLIAQVLSFKDGDQVEVRYLNGDSGLYSQDNILGLSPTGCSEDGGVRLCPGSVVKDYQGDKCIVNSVFREGYIECRYPKWKKLRLNYEKYVLSPQKYTLVD